MTPASSLVSVIVAAYNAQDTLESCVNSILSQTHHNLEVIIADDASKDGTLAVAEKIAHGDSRVSVVSCGRNGGPGEARNAALEAAQGEWFMVVDSDDRILPERIEKMLEAAKESRADVVFDNLIYVPADKSESRPYIPLDLNVFGELPLERYVESHRRCSSSPSLGFLKPMAKLGLLGSIRYRHGLRIGEDTMLVLDLYAAGAKVALMRDGYYMYQKRATSISAFYQLHHIEALTAELKNYLEKHMTQLGQNEVKALQTLISDNENRIQARKVIASRGILLSMPGLISNRIFVQEWRSALKKKIKSCTGKAG